MADPEFVNAWVNWAALSPINLQSLKDKFQALGLQIQAGQGKNVVSVTVPGQTVSWGQSLTIEDFFATLSQVLNILNGTPTIMRRTTARFF
jgi:hypothetical protein